MGWGGGRVSIKVGVERERGVPPLTSNLASVDVKQNVNGERGEGGGGGGANKD